MVKIIGVTVGTPTSPTAMAEKLSPELQGAIDTALGAAVDETLSYENGVLSVNTAKEPDPDNTLPITSAAVATTVGNIAVLLKTI